MGFSLDDLRKYIEDVTATLSGKNRNQVGGEATYQGIVAPLKLGAEVSGVADTYRALEPNASPMDKALGALALAGFLGAQEANVIGDAFKNSRIANKVKDSLDSKYTYGIHVSPENNLKKIKSSMGEGKNAYFWELGNQNIPPQSTGVFNRIDNNLMDAYLQLSKIDPSVLNSKSVHDTASRVGATNPLFQATGWGDLIKFFGFSDEPSYYLTKTKTKNVRPDLAWDLPGIAPAAKSKKNLKVLDVIKGSKITEKNLAEFVAKNKK